MAPTLFRSQVDSNVAIKLKADEWVDEEDTNKAHLITIELKVQAGSTFTSAHKYKKHIRVFDVGSPVDFVLLIQAMEEVWRQNSLAAANDRQNIVKMVLKGESYTMYESQVAELMEEAAVNAPTNEFVQAGLDAVAVDVFPHCDLFFQKRWMQNGMRKPRSMTNR